MDYWVYPVGTKLWKEFTRDGIRVETRLLYKTDPDSWYKVAYVWNAEQTEAIAATGPVVDVLGTPHNVPSRSECNKCHDRGGDVAIGFTALLLDHAPYDDLEDQVTLDTLIADGILSVPPDGPAAPHFPIPGSPVVRDALGYIHANCGNCHNPTSDIQDEFTTPIVMRLEVADMATPEQTAAYTTMVGVPAELQAGDATARIAPCSPDHSAVVLRMLSRGAIGMPPVGSEVVDDDGLAAMTAWINSFSCQ
jgi:hypothetical protein